MGLIVGACGLEHMHGPGSEAVPGLGQGKAHGPAGIEALPVAGVFVHFIYFVMLISFLDFPLIAWPLFWLDFFDFQFSTLVVS